jgi:hypothetical protein
VDIRRDRANAHEHPHAHPLAHARRAVGRCQLHCSGGPANPIDAALVLQLGAGLLGALACQHNADVNDDGAANAIDAALILQYAAGLLATL